MRSWSCTNSPDQSLPEDALWLIVGESLGASWDRKRSPTRSQLQAALSERPLVLILDEIERGVDSIGDPARRSQNLSFLQMLTEEAAQSPRVTVFAAIYDGNKEPGSTLKRTVRIELRFRKPEDRAAIVPHRLFADAESYDRNAARIVTRSYINVWKQFGVETSDAYAARMESAFPFLPDLIDLVFERITVSGGFQGTRGALGLLAEPPAARSVARFLEANPGAAAVIFDGCRHPALRSPSTATAA